MIDLPYSLIIEATKEPDYFGFFLQSLRASRASATPLRTACIRQNGG